MGEEVKYHINCQFEHGLSDSSVKTRNFLCGGLQVQKNMHFLD